MNCLLLNNAYTAKYYSTNCHFLDFSKQNIVFNSHLAIIPTKTGPTMPVKQPTSFVSAINEPE